MGFWTSLAKCVTGIGTTIKALVPRARTAKLPPSGEGVVVTSPPSPGGASGFRAHQQTWPVSREGRPVRVYVVEPSEYRVTRHAGLFLAAMTHLLVRPIERVDSYESAPPLSAFEPFDIVVFPEAFLRSDALVAFLHDVSIGPPMGCVHVGLRPAGDGEPHMFSIAQIDALVRALRQLPTIVGTDLDTFSSWLERNRNERRPVNLGCLFAKDRDQRLRICLHPKIVRSKVEFGRLEDRQMLEGDLLTLVTLQPSDPTLTPITIQPLLCSDALELETDNPRGGPLPAVSAPTSCLQNPPDTVDIVTVAACSPQTRQENGGTASLRWHKDYLDCFFRAASAPSLHRHRGAVFVLANFKEVPASDGKPAKPGGLSGAFVPLELRDTKFPDYVSLYLYGRPGEEENRWIAVNGDLPQSWSTRGYIAALSPTATTAVAATTLGFTIDRLPREINAFRGIRGLTSLRISTARDTDDEGTYEFRPVDL